MPKTRPDGGRETVRHLTLKAQIAGAVKAAGWEVEVEAEHRGPNGALVWKADVLARRGRASVAFEVELSKPDWNSMRERQARYKRSGVRGLWFFKSRKPFPMSHELPVFILEPDENEERVCLDHPSDRASFGETEEPPDLNDFIEASLKGNLRWAPLAKQKSGAATSAVSCEAAIRILGGGKCLGCGRLIGHPYAIEMSVLSMEHPPFYWHQCMRWTRRTFWPDHLIALAQTRAADHPRIGILDDETRTCTACGADARRLGDGGPSGLLRMQLGFQELPRARFGTIEWDWINRWVLG